MSDGDLSEQPSPARFSTGSQFRLWSSASNDSVLSNVHDEDEELDSANAQSDLIERVDDEQEFPNDVDKLKAEIQTLRAQLQLHEEKERERKRGILYAEFLQWAPKVQQEGWLTNKVRKAYAACQKIVEALDSGN